MPATKKRKVKLKLTPYQKFVEFTGGKHELDVSTDAKREFPNEAIVKKLKIPSIILVRYRYRLRAETNAKEKIARSVNRPKLHRDKKGNVKNAKRTKKGKW